MNLAISVENVSYRYGDKVALNGVSLELATGKSLALVGPNGGGKSTLFRLLTTLTRPHSGQVKLFGVSTSSRSQTAHRVGVVFQNPALDGKLTVEENLVCQGAIYGLRKNETAARIDKWLALVELSDRKKDRVDKLSGGLKRRLEIARACLVEPELLLMDEPTSSLDPKARQEIWSIIGTLRKNGLTLLFTTHLLDEADKADTVVFVDQGEVVISGTPSALRASLGGDIVTIASEANDTVLKFLRESLGLTPAVVDGEIRVETDKGGEWIPKVLNAHKGIIRQLTIGKPTLADLFFQKTGRRYAEAT